MSSGPVMIRKKERINGWSWPPHPFQVVAWFFVVTIPLVYYGSIVSHLPHRWIPAGCSVSFTNTRYCKSSILFCTIAANV
jgi:hypothetical protein